MYFSYTAVLYGQLKVKQKCCLHKHYGCLQRMFTDLTANKDFWRLSPAWMWPDKYSMLLLPSAWFQEFQAIGRKCPNICYWFWTRFHHGLSDLLQHHHEPLGVGVFTAPKPDRLWDKTQTRLSKIFICERLKSELTRQLAPPKNILANWTRPECFCKLFRTFDPTWPAGRPALTGHCLKRFNMFNINVKLNNEKLWTK